MTGYGHAGFLATIPLARHGAGQEPIPTAADTLPDRIRAAVLAADWRRAAVAEEIEALALADLLRDIRADISAAVPGGFPFTAAVAS